MKDEIKIITLGDIFKNLETEEKAFKFKNYITNLQEENEILKELNVCVGCNNNPDYKTRIDKAIEYGKNCLENIKDQDQYMCKSIDIFRMIHKNYLDILQGDDKQ